MSSTQNFIREPAKRVLAVELSKIKESSTIELEDGKTKNLIETEAGTQLNRVFIVGILTEVESSKKDNAITMKARINDMTGNFIVHAGQYQPEAAAFLQTNMNENIIVAVIGKVNIYTPADDPNTKIPIIRPEFITISDEDTRNYWIREATATLEKQLTTKGIEDPYYNTKIEAVKNFLMENSFSSSKPSETIPPKTPIPASQKEQTKGTSSQPPESIPCSSNPEVLDNGLTEQENYALELICEKGNGKIVSVASIMKEMGIEQTEIETILHSLQVKKLITRKMPAFVEPVTNFSQVPA
jgi:RPA family protein